MNLRNYSLVFVSILILSGAALAQQSSSGRNQNSPERRVSVIVNGGNFLGVRTEDLTRENMSRFGAGEMRGAVVTEVVQGSPAERAGLRKDDVIVRFDNESVTSPRKLNRLIGESAPEATVRLTVKRGGGEQEISATLGKRESLENSLNRLTVPQTEELRRRLEGLQGLQRNRDGNFTFFNAGASRRIGVTTQPLTKQLADYFGVASGDGLLITAVGENSPAAKAGLRAGDVITEADGTRVRTTVDLAQSIGRKTDGDVSLTFVRDKQSRTVRVTPERNSNSDFRFDFAAPNFELFTPTIRTIY